MALRGWLSTLRGISIKSMVAKASLIFILVCALMGAANAQGQPINMTATAVSQSQINLTWTLTWDPETYGFWIRVLRWTASTGQVTVYMAQGTESYNDTGLASGTTYYYCVEKGWPGEGGGFDPLTACSNTASATTFSAPSAPSGLSASAISGTQINLAWTDTSSNETGFKIERKLGAGGTYAQIATPAANAAAYSDSGVTAGNTYYYRIRASNIVGDSAYSAETSVNFTAPSAPSGLSGTAASSTQINLAWTDTSSNELSYKISRKLGAGGTYAQIATRAANATAYSDSGVTAGNTYYYRIRASNIVGDSAYSAETSVNFTAPSAPSGLSGTAASSTQINLAWTDTSSNELSYKISRKL